MVETTVTTIESAANTASESCALMTTRPALSPHTSTDVPGVCAGMTMRCSTPPPHPRAGRAINESLGERKIVRAAESVRLNVNGTETLPPLPTASEPFATPQRSSAGGACTTFTSVESL